MKFLLIYLVLLFPLTIGDSDRLDKRFRLLYSDAVKCRFDQTLDLDVSETKVYFYDFTHNVSISCTIANALDCITEFLNLDVKKRIIVFVPGYKCYIKRDIEELVRQTYKDVPDIYLLIVDHSAYSYESKEKLRSYERSVLYSYYIGNALGGLLAKFNGAGYSAKSFHCIGHSLGAHILGYAGERYFLETSGKFWKTTGLDPAGPCFANAARKFQLRSGNAEYVEVYHCNAGHLGTTNTIGDVDFFFNNEGKIQPDCPERLSDEELAKCYHKACVKYWTKSVHNPRMYPAVACSSYKAFVEGSCHSNVTTFAGHSNPGEARGVFYISTKFDSI